MSVELEIVRFFNELGKGTVVDSISWLISTYVFMAFIFGAFTLFIIYKNFNNKGKIKVFLTALVIAIILHFAITGFLIKGILVDFTGVRERPYLVDESLNAIGQNNIDSSFPSGHMSITLALCAVFIYFYRNKVNYIILIGFIVLMAFSRIHNAMHYLSDISGGILFGIGYGLIAVYFSKFLWKEKTE